MARIDKAYLAVIQRFRDYYAHRQDLEVALRPISAIDTPIVEAISNKGNWENPNDKYENEFLVAGCANEVIKTPYTYTTTDEDLSNIYKGVLDFSETTEELVENYATAKNIFDTQKVFAIGLGEYLKTNLSNPTWRKETLEANEFDALIRRAESDPEFMTAFNASFGTSEDKSEVTKVVFEKAEIDIQRFWLNNQYLNSRDWRLKADRTINGKAHLSQSEQDYSGALPGYPTKFILVRKVEIHFKVDDASEGKKTRVENGHIINFGNLLLHGIRRSNEQIFSVKGLKTKQISMRAIKYSSMTNTHADIKMENFYTEKPPFYMADILRKLQLQTVIQPQQPIINIQRPVVDISRIRPFVSPFKTLKFKVVNARDIAIAKAEIIIRPEGAKNYEAYQKVETDEIGVASIVVVKDKTYTIAITKRTYKPLVQTIPISNRTTETLNLSMTKEATSTTRQEQVTDIQVLGIVYKKLNKIPNPIPNFQAVEESF